MKTSKKTKLISIILSAAACVALVFGVSFGCLYKPSTPTEQNGFSDTAKTQPDDTSKYWDESDEIQALITAGKTENQWQGSGTETDPYQISSALDLAWLAYRLNNKSGGGIYTNYYFYQDTYFKQTVDLDLSKYWWRPIGGWSSSGYYNFSGNYNGDNRIVSGVFTKDESGTGGNSNKAIFGRIGGQLTTKNCLIQNLIVKDSVIKGSNSCAGVVGIANSYSIIKNCSFFGKVEATNSQSGGIVGNSSGGDNISIISCYNAGEIKSTGSNVGGIIGYAVASTTNSAIRNCYNISNISGDGDYVGGIVGYLGKSWELTNCYNNANIEGTTGVGGIAGQSNASCKVLNNWNIGSIKGNSYSGGVVGRNYSSTITNCFYGGDCTLTRGVGSGTDTTTKSSTLTTDAKTLSWYKDSTKWDSTYPWNFDTVWKINPKMNNGYPVLKWEPEPYTYKGEGTEASPYLIDSEKALRLMAENVNSGVDNSAYFKQTADIRLTQGEWTPIGTFPGTNPFSGYYDGGNYNISGMIINLNSNDTNIGLFGSSMGEITNVHLRDSIIMTTGPHVGSIAGLATSITNCSSNAVIMVDTSSTCGGIVGIGSTVVNSTFTGRISISTQCYAVAGIVAQSGTGSIVESCINYGTIETNYADGYVGGIAGRSGGRISNCISYGTLKGLGSIASIIAWASNCTIENCSGFGMIYCADADKSAGIVANITTACNANNCLFIGSSNHEIGLFYASAISTSPTLTSCYGQINDRKGRTTGDFNGWSIVNGINNNLPIQNELYSVANWSNRGSDVIAKLEELGFKEVA